MVSRDKPPGAKCRYFFDGQWIGGTPKALERVIGRALVTAQSAYSLWSKVDRDERLGYLNELLRLLEASTTEFSSIIQAETNKLPSEASSEVSAALSEGRYQLDYYSHHYRDEKAGFEILRCAIGVVLVITPWNFPLATIVRKLIPALAAGNTVILKPSEFAPSTADKLVQLIERTNFPVGVATLIQGDGATCVAKILEQDVVKAVSLTGSCGAGEAISELLGSRDIRFQAELGGSNAVVICGDADIDAAANEIVEAAFACGGQWCTGTGRVIVEHEVHDDFLSALSRLMTRDARAFEMGSQANSRQWECVKSLVDTAIGEGATLFLQGPVKSSNGDSLYFPATVLCGVTQRMQCAKAEVFGPVLLVFSARDFEHAIELVNDSRFGLSVSLYSTSPNKAERFIVGAEAGLVHINLPTSHRALDAPLFGWKSSGRGWPECGPDMLSFLTRPKVVYRK